jgi:hypothetical protein
MKQNPLRLFAAVVLLAGVTAVRASIPPAENLLPADTLAFFTVPDYAAFRASAQHAPTTLLWNDPAMKAFHDQFMAKWNETYVAPLEKDLSLKVEDFLALPQGQLTFAVTVNGSNGHDDVPPGILVLLDARGKSDLLKTNLAALTKKWTDAGRKLRTEKIRGLTFTVVPVDEGDFAGLFSKHPATDADADKDKPAKAKEIYFTQFESLLIAGNVPAAVETAAARLTGGSVPVIADDATFAGDKLSQFRDAPTAYGWFNGVRFVNLIIGGDTANADENPATLLPKMNAAKVVGALGLGGLKSASFAVRQSPDGLGVTLHLTAPAAARAGLVKILALSPKDASVPAFVPADAVKFSRFRLDGRQTWDDLQKMVAAISPQALVGLNSVIETANVVARSKDPGFDLRTALFGNLGDDVIIYGKSPTGDSLAKLVDAPSLYLVAVSNPEQVINAVKSLITIASPQEGAPAPRDFLGHKIYSLAKAGGQTADGKVVPPTYTYLSASGGYLAVSADAGLLEEFLRSADGKLKPLAETPGLAELAAHVGGTGGGLFTYEDQREAMRVTFKFLKAASERGATLQMLPPAYKDWTDFALLPDFDLVSKYFYRSVVGGRADADGLTLKIFTARPPQLN